MRASWRPTTGCSGDRRSSVTARLPVRFQSANGAWPSGMTDDCTPRARRPLSPANDTASHEQDAARAVWEEGPSLHREPDRATDADEVTEAVLTVGHVCQ